MDNFFHDFFFCSGVFFPITAPSSLRIVRFFHSHHHISFLPNGKKLAGISNNDYLAKNQARATLFMPRIFKATYWDSPQ